MKKCRKITIIIFITLVSLLLITAAFATFLLRTYLSKITYETESNSSESKGNGLSDEEILQELLAEEPISDEIDSPAAEIIELENQMEEHLKGSQEQKWQDADPEKVIVPEQSDVEDVVGNVNILLIGCDSRKQDGVGRSDAMILVSVNGSSETIHMASIMRDCYVFIPGKGNNRINAAYAFGGGSLLLDTVEMNFAVDVDRYIAFDFYSFVDIVDSIGGIDIEVTEAEIPVLNGYVKELNKLNARAEGTYYLTESGLQHLNGTQALGYARIRYVGDGDFERTSRQRIVIQKVFEKAKTLNLLEINDLLNTFLPQVKTNLTQEEILSLLLKALEYLQYDLESHRLPVDDSWEYMRVNGMSVLGIDLEKNQKALKEFISQ